MKEECPHPVPLMHAVSAPSTLTATVIVYVCVWCVTGAACTWRSEVSFLEEPVLSFHCMGPRGQMQIVSTGSRSLPLPAPAAGIFWAGL